MRVADRTTTRNYLKYLDKAKTDWSTTNERIASGNRFTAVSQDVSAATGVMDAKSAKYKLEKQHGSVQSINEELSTAEDSMRDINEILTQVHVKALKAVSEEKGSSGRKALENEIKALRDEMLQYMNIQYGNRYCFGGTNVGSAPFTVDKDSGKIKYNGVDVDTIQKDADGNYFHYSDPDDPTSEKLPIPMDGDTYMDIGLGIKMSGPDVDPNTAFKISYSGLDFLGFGVDADGKSNNLFNAVTDVLNCVKNYDEEVDKDSNAKLTAASDKLQDLNDGFLANITDMGARTNFLDTMEGKLKDGIDKQSIKISRLMGTNDAEEASNQVMNDYVLKAVIQMGAKILPISLMDYIR